MSIQLTGIELIAQERQEQLTKHGRTIEQDVELNKWGQLIDGAGQLIATSDPITGFTTPQGWSVAIFSKMIGKSYKERLIIAGALIAAELDRLQDIDATTLTDNQ